MGEKGPEVVIPDIKFAGQVTLPPEQEQQFQTWIQATPWYQEFLAKYGEPPDVNGPGYNYRRAWLAGISPDYRHPADQQFHWSDALPSGEILKSPYHESAWAEPFIRTFGINPDELAPDDPRVVAFKAKWREKYPVQRQ